MVDNVGEGNDQRFGRRIKGENEKIRPRKDTYQRCHQAFNAKDLFP